MPQLLGFYLRCIVETHTVAALVHCGAFVLAFVVCRCRDYLIGLACYRLANGGVLVVLYCFDKCCSVVGGCACVCGLQCIVCFAIGVADAATYAVFENVSCLNECTLASGILGGLDIVLCIFVVEQFENLVVALQASVERTPVLLCCWQPANLGESEHAGEQLVFYLVYVVCSLGPHVALHAKCILLAALQVAQRVQVIYLFNGIYSPTAVVELVEKEVALFGLHKVEVEVLVRHDNRFHAPVGCLSTVSNAVPCHNHWLYIVTVVPVRQQFVPHNNVLAVLFFNVCSKFLYQPRLQLVYAVEPEFFYSRKALGVGAPLLCGALVATKVYVLVGEYLGEIVHDAFEEVNHTVVTDIQNVFRNTAVDAYAILLCGVATEFRVCSYCGNHVAGEVDFGHNFDVAGKGILHNLFKVVL